MKTILPLLAIMALVGCSHSPAKVPENYTITETSHECNGNSCRVVTRTLPASEIPRTQGQMVGSVVELGPPPAAGEVDDNPYEEIERNENLLKAMKEAVERDTPCKCQQGDPLCACLNGHE